MLDGAAEERFWGFVFPEPMSGCWLWAGFDNGERGYGKFMYKRKALYAHRVAYELSVGPIPKDLVLDHKCRTPCCVNPAHLEPVTFGENMRRGAGAKRMKARTHCPHGHPFSGENLQIRENGARRCVACLRRDQKKWSLKRAAKTQAKRLQNA